LAGKINGHLMRLNTEYESKMHSGRLRPVTLRQVPPGTWERLRRRKMSYRGVSVEQYKHPYLVIRLKFLEELDPPTTRNAAHPAA